MGGLPQPLQPEPLHGPNSWVPIPDGPELDQFLTDLLGEDALGPEPDIAAAPDLCPACGGDGCLCNAYEQAPG